MGISKVIYGGDVLIDLTGDTVESSKLLTGITAHGKDGEAITGSCNYDADTSNANATASTILTGSTAFVKGVKVTGAMVNNGAVAGTISEKAGAYTVPVGYHDGSGKVTISKTEQDKLIAKNIREGVTVLGVLGTLSPSENIKAEPKTVTPAKTPITVLPSSGFDYLTQVTVNAIPYTETDNEAGGVTVTIG